MGCYDEPQWGLWCRWAKANGTNLPEGSPRRDNVRWHFYKRHSFRSRRSPKGRKP